MDVKGDIALRTLVLQHIACEPPGVFEDVLRERGAEFHRVELDEGDALPDWREFDAIVAMSGPMSATADGELPWLSGGRKLIAAGRPALGICAGMQLLVTFAGGAIGPYGRSEHGFLPIQIHDGSDLLRGLPAEVVVFHDHDHEIATLPTGFRVLAGSPECAVQAIADSGRRWWGTQFHPEESSPEHPAGARVLWNFFALAE